MLLVARIHCSWEQQLDIRLRLVYSWRVDISLSFVLNVSLNALLDFHDHLARQISQQVDCFLLPAHTSIGFEEVRDIVVGRLRDGALEHLTSFSAAKVSVVLCNVDLVETGATDYRRFCTLLL